ncbi:YihY/virulence factor BrkB family protein [Cystobacter fuscus]
MLYVVTPNTHVRWRSALAGGLVAGVAWSVARHLYTGIAAYSFRHNPLYASLGALPMFLAWLYVDWLILLGGARLSYAVEHATFRDSLWAFGAHPRARSWWPPSSPRRPPSSGSTALRPPSPGAGAAPARRRVARRRGGRGPGARGPARAPPTWGTASRPPPQRVDPGRPDPRGSRRLQSRRPWRLERSPAPGFEPLAAFFHEADSLGLEVLRRTRWLDRPSWCARGWQGCT